MQLFCIIQESCHKYVQRYYVLADYSEVLILIHGEYCTTM